jgi:hypothetical protein
MNLIEIVIASWLAILVIIFMPHIAVMVAILGLVWFIACQWKRLAEKLAGEEE